MMVENESSLFEEPAKIVLCVVGIGVYVFSVSKVYNWFLLEKFHLPILTISDWVGIGFFKSIIFYKYKEDSNSIEDIVRSILGGCILLILAYVFKRFVY